MTDEDILFCMDICTTRDGPEQLKGLKKLMKYSSSKTGLKWTINALLHNQNVNVPSDN